MSKGKQVIVEMHEEERINELLESGYAFERRLTDRLVILNEDTEITDRKLVRLENNLEELQDLLDDGYQFNSHGIFPGRAFVYRRLEKSKVFVEEPLTNATKELEDTPSFSDICKYALSANTIYTRADNYGVCTFWDCDMPTVEVLPNKGEIILGDFVLKFPKEEVKELMEKIKDIEEKNDKIKKKETLGKIR